MANKKRVLLGCLGSAIVLCGVGGWLGWRSSDLGRAAAELDQAIVDAKAAGVPWVAADIAQKPPVKDSENAAPIYTAIGQMERTQGVGKALGAFTKALNDHDEGTVGTKLAELASLISMARKAADKPKCDFHHDFDQGAWLLFPEYARQKSLVKVLATVAVREARAGQTAQAVADLRRCMRIADHAGADPILIGLLVQISCQAIAVRGVEQAAEAWAGSAPRLSLLRPLVQGDGRDVDFKKALRGEQYFGIATIRNLRSIRELRALSGGSDDETNSQGWIRYLPDLGADSRDYRKPPTHPLRSGTPRSLFARIFLCRHLQMWTRAIRQYASIDDPIQIGYVLDRIATEEEHAGMSHVLNAILMPVFSQAGVAVVKIRAQKACTDGLLAALQFKAGRGRYPGSLQEAGFRGIDPFDGKPLRYRVESGVCKVYSVGPDKKDNGGMQRSDLPPEKSSAEGWDIVAQYPSHHKKQS